MPLECHTLGSESPVTAQISADSQSALVAVRPSCPAPAACPPGREAGAQHSGDPVTPPTAGNWRVLHVINGEHYSGAERVQDLLAARLPEFGFDVGFACVKPGRFPQARQYTQAPLYQLPMRSKLDWAVIQQLVRLIRSEGYELVHAHTPRSALVARAASWLAHVPMVYHVHSPAARETTHRWQNLVYRWSERVSLIGASALLTVSHSLKQHMLAEGYKARMLFPVPNGVPAPSESRDDRPPGPDWTLGTVALFRPRKGIEVLLEALALLKQQRLPVRLRAVGGFETPEYEWEIHELVQQLDLEDCVEWTGFTRQVDRELTRMDVFVLPSLFGEGLPMVVLEAMAAGVPVVATRVEGVPEAIEDRVSGLIAAPGDAADLARRLAGLIRGEINWSEIRRHAQRRHHEHFSDRSMAARVAAVYRRILTETPPPAADDSLDA